MAAANNQTKAWLMEEIIRSGGLAYSPEISADERESGLLEFNKLLESTKTLLLMPILTSLVQPDRVASWLRSHLIQALASLPLRPRGVRHTVEFVLSVHPSTTMQEDSASSSTAKTRGPNISLDALKSASRLISSPPRTFTPQAWFLAIAPQLFELLDGQGGLEMVKVASYIIGYGILGRREYGAPGAPGWEAFAEPILQKINPSPVRKKVVIEKSSKEILRPQNIVVTSAELAEALRRLASLLSSHPNPGLSKRLLENILLPLWCISSWNAADGPLEEWRAPAQYLLQIRLQLSVGSELLAIADHIAFQYTCEDGSHFQTYSLASGGGIQVEKSLTVAVGLHPDEDGYLDMLDQKVDAFIELLKPLQGIDGVPGLFIHLCKKWLSWNDSEQAKIVLSAAEEDLEEIEEKIVHAKLLQKMIDAIPERLIGESSEVLKIANEVLCKSAASGGDFDAGGTTTIALSLVSMVFTSTNVQVLDQGVRDAIKLSLRTIGARSNSDASSTARNLLMLIEIQSEDLPSEENDTPIEDKDAEDRKVYRLALSYFTASESPPPVRAQGLDLISSLISSNSPILDIPALLVLLSSSLQDDEEYIYLRAIKALTALSNKHPKAVMQDIIERYVDRNEESSLDARLRLGETLLQVVEKAGATFTGDIAQEVGEGLLVIGGRRGYRPKQNTRQLNAIAASRRKVQEAEVAWDGPVPNMEDSTADDEFIDQIIEGWEGKNGEEDVRIRASALSIFGSAIEVNVAGIGSSLVGKAVDLSVNTLAIEAEPEKAILRRSAILLIMSLIRALDKARDEKQNLGFGFAGSSLDDVSRILEYISSTDNDGLVRQHAKDVVAELAAWQLKSLTRPQGSGRFESGELSGLSLQTPNSLRPRIEEIE